MIRVTVYCAANIGERAFWRKRPLPQRTSRRIMTGRTDIGRVYPILSSLLFLLLTGCQLPPTLPSATIDNQARVVESAVVVETVSLGPRPFYLLDQLREGPLRTQLEACRAGPFLATQFSIGHRGAPLQFPEHTRVSYRAAARMGAGTLECDVTFTRDQKLVCRHSQCDLATTTNILETPLAKRCATPFKPARINPSTGELETAASARCCTSEFTWAELQTLAAKMDSFDPRATTPEMFIRGTTPWRTDLYSSDDQILSHDQSIALFRSLGTAMTPELKAPSVAMPFEGTYTQTDYARAIVDDYRLAGIPPSDVFLQSFDIDVHREWITYAPEFSPYAILGVEPSAEVTTQNYLDSIRQEGIRTVAAPTSMLLNLDNSGRIVATQFAKDLRAAGIEIVAWTLERSGRIQDGRIEGNASDFYLGSMLPSLENDGDVYRIIDALNLQVGVIAIFSDWPATVTYYANCVGLN